MIEFINTPGLHFLDFTIMFPRLGLFTFQTKNVYSHDILRNLSLFLESHPSVKFLRIGYADDGSDHRSLDPPFSQERQTDEAPNLEERDIKFDMIESLQINVTNNIEELFDVVELTGFRKINYVSVTYDTGRPDIGQISKMCRLPVIKNLEIIFAGATNAFGHFIQEEIGKESRSIDPEKTTMKKVLLRIVDFGVTGKSGEFEDFISINVG